MPDLLAGAAHATDADADAGADATRATGATVGAVLFDLDDTLLDGDAAWRSGVARLCARCPGLGHAEALAAWEAAFHAHFDRFLAGETSAEEMRAGRIRTWGELVAASVAGGDELEWFAEYQAGYEAGWQLFADARPVLDALRARADLRLGVVTNGESDLQRQKLDALGITAYFDVVVVSGDHGWPKPDRRIFERAVAGVGVPAGRCLFVGDRQDVDVAGAAAAGLQAVWLNRADAPPAPGLGPSPSIASLEALLALVAAPGSPTPPPGPGPAA